MLAIAIPVISSEHGNKKNKYNGVNGRSAVVLAIQVFH